MTEIQPGDRLVCIKVDEAKTDLYAVGLLW